MLNFRHIRSRSQSHTALVAPEMMSLPFGATLKELVRRYPLDWLAGLELDAELPVRALDVDLSTVSATADTVLGIGDPLSSLVHIEFQSSRDASLARRLLKYNGLLHERFAVPVHSAVVLLRRQADAPAMSGTLRYDTQGGRAGIEFRFEVMRIWQRPASAMLSGGLGLVPLATLGEIAGGRSAGGCFDRRLAADRRAA